MRRCVTDGCQREPMPNFAHCPTCFNRLLAQAFGTPERDYRVERLSALDPELTIKGRRVA